MIKKRAKGVEITLMARDDKDVQGEAIEGVENMIHTNNKKPLLRREDTVEHTIRGCLPQ